MNRRTLAVTIVVVWLAAVAWLARRELWRPRAAVRAEATLGLPPGAAYYTVTLGDRQVGYASTTVDTLADTVRVSEVLVLDQPGREGPRRTAARTDVTLSRALRLRTFTATVRGDDSRFVARGRVEGDSLLSLEVTGGATSEIRRIRLDGPPILPQTLPLDLAFGGALQTGAVLTRRVFDPILLRTREVVLTVAAESTIVLADSAVFDSVAGRFQPVDTDTLVAWALEGTDGGLPLQAWVDEDGLLVRATAPSGLRLERTAFEVAYENYRPIGGPPRAPDDPVVRRTAIAAGAAPPVAAAERLRVRLGGQSFSGLDLSGGRQRLAGDTLTVTREGEDALNASYRLPAGRRELTPFLRPEPLIASDDPRLAAQARLIVGRARPRQAAALLVDWVYRNVRPVPAADIPSALAALETRRGDCNEHTLLFVALARAVGLPARTAAGLVALDSAFYYHAWPEVYLNGWVAVDPTFGQFPADAARIRFRWDALARPLELAWLVGPLTVERLPTND